MLGIERMFKKDLASFRVKKNRNLTAQLQSKGRLKREHLKTFARNSNDVRDVVSKKLPQKIDRRGNFLIEHFQGEKIKKIKTRIINHTTVGHRQPLLAY